MTPWLAAFVVTLAVEVPLLSAFAYRAQWAAPDRALVGAVGVNVVTHPVLYAVSVGFGSPWQLVVAEMLVVVAETWLLAWWWSISGREETVTLALAVVAANAGSTALGLLVL